MTKIRLRVQRATLATLLLMGTLGVAGGGAPAAAQTGYPPGPCMTTATSELFGTLRIGAVVTIQLIPLCSWTPGTLVAIEVNGVFIANKTVTLNGSVSVGITVLSATLLSIDDPVLVPVVCGTNSAVASGGSPAANAMVTKTVMFDVDCVSPPLSGVLSSASSGFLARTGANLLRAAAVAACLVTLGAVIVVPSRKRRRSPGSKRLPETVS